MAIKTIWMPHSRNKNLRSSLSMRSKMIPIGPKTLLALNILNTVISKYAIKAHIDISHKLW